MVASTGVKASFASGGHRRSHAAWAAMRGMAFIAIRITGSQKPGFDYPRRYGSP